MACQAYPLGPPHTLLAHGTNLQMLITISFPPGLPAEYNPSEMLIPQELTSENIRQRLVAPTEFIHDCTGCIGGISNASFNPQAETIDRVVAVEVSWKYDGSSSIRR